MIWIIKSTSVTHHVFCLHHIEVKPKAKFKSTSFTISWRVVVMAEKSGRSTGFVAQQCSSSSASFGGVVEGMVGRKP
jgi:hypothetical protein